MIKYLAFEKFIYDYLGDEKLPVDEIKAQLRRYAKDRYHRLRMLADFTIDQTQESLLGLIIGQRITNAAYGVLGQALINSNSLLESHRFMLKHIWVWQQGPSDAVTLHVDDNYIYLNYNQPPDWQDNSNFLVDLFFSANLKRSRELIEGDIKGAFLQLKRSAPSDHKRYESLLKLPVEFSQVANRLVFPRKIAEAPLSSSYLIHSEAYQRHCEKLLLKMRSASGLTGQVCLAIAHSGKTKLKETQMASQLNVSVRTLKRRLLTEGTSYREIQQKMQFDLAQSYLADTELSVADIASLVGYFDAATFSRAFKNWSSYTPSQFRKNLNSQSAKN